jgi:signal transduction histidine kinase
MLQEFITTYRDAIIAKARGKLTARPWRSATANELENGVPLFLTQLAATLEAETVGVTASSAAMQSTASSHGRDLLALGFSVSQVIHDYGDICQAITELALAQNAPITTEEFHTLNRCLDTAIAEAVTEHARITAELRSHDESERSGHLAHETRDILNTAFVAFEMLKSGTVAINGSTGAILGRSLIGLRELVNNQVSDIRLAKKHQRCERLSVASLLGEVAMAGALHAEYRHVRFVFEPVDPDLILVADPQLIASAVTNLLNNAYKFTRAGGSVVLRARAKDGRLVIEVEDECGGIPNGVGDPFRSFSERRGADRTGLGLGLSIARKAIRSHNGDIYVRNMPGKGCVFSIELPLGVQAPVT